MKVGVVPARLLGHLNRWDARHVLAVKDEMDRRDIDLDDAEGAKACSDDLKLIESLVQKERRLPCPKPTIYP